MKLGYLILVLAALWLAAAVYFFVLHFAGSGMIPLAVPVVLLVMSAACAAAFFWFRKLTAGMKKKK